jgi:hypothetical protein
MVRSTAGRPTPAQSPQDVDASPATASGADHTCAEIWLRSPAKITARGKRFQLSDDAPVVRWFEGFERRCGRTRQRDYREPRQRSGRSASRCMPSPMLLY